MAPASLHVLLVEDDDDTREVLRLILESDGMCVTPAQDGLEALLRIEELRERDAGAPYAIVLDYMMPRFSGAQFRERQLANPAIARVPVILVSAVSDLPSHAAALNPFAVLQKPIDPDELTTVVREACHAYLSWRAL
jgi:two-component system, chemotaxis family, chemotaxis protein CheY